MLTRTLVPALLPQAMAGWREVGVAPRLYLYSQADSIIPASDIEAAIAADRKRGLGVSAVCFSGSEHVAHYREHPEQYATACLEFTRLCTSKAELDRQRKRVSQLRQDLGIGLHRPGGRR